MVENRLKYHVRKIYVLTIKAAEKQTKFICALSAKRGTFYVHILLQPVPMTKNLICVLQVDKLVL